jgi:prepilin signal peptidase PulO-like enzyme (type II secretory pathway)
MDLASVGLTVVVGAAGGLCVAPYVSYVVLRWMGWRVTLPLLAGYVPQRASIGAPPVQCRACGANLSPARTWSWVWWRGRCRACGEPVAGWVAAIELATAIAFGVAAWRIGWSWSLLPVLVLCAGLVAASAVDLACWRIPTRFVYLTGLVVFGTMLFVAAVAGEPGSIVGALVGASAYFGLLAAMHLASPRLLGFGDVRLGFLIGSVVGWMSWSPDLPVLDPLAGVLQALLLASLAGSVVGLGLLVLRRRNQPYPFGPWLSLGGFVTVLLAAPGAL